MATTSLNNSANAGQVVIARRARQKEVIDHVSQSMSVIDVMVEPRFSNLSRPEGKMTTIPTPTSIPEAVGMIDDAMSYFESAEFNALPLETRLECFEQLIVISRTMKLRALTEYIRRRWDGTVTWSYERPMTGSTKASSPAS